MPQWARVRIEFPLFAKFSDPAPAFRPAADPTIEDAEHELAVALLHGGEQLPLEACPGAVLRRLVHGVESAFLRVQRRGAQRNGHEQQRCDEPRHHLPLNTPPRFSKNAASASRWSSVFCSAAWNEAALSRCSPMSWCCARRSARLA